MRAFAFILLLLSSAAHADNLMMTGMSGGAPPSPTHIQTGGAAFTSNFSTSLTGTLGQAVASGDAVCIALNAPSPSSVTESPNTSNTFTQVAIVAGAGGTGSVWCRANITDGPTSFIANFGGVANGTMIIDEFSNVATASLVSGTPTTNDQTYTGQSGANFLVSGNTTPAIANCMIYGATFNVQAPMAMTIGTANAFVGFGGANYNGTTGPTAVGAFSGTFSHFVITEGFVQGAAAAVQATWGLASSSTSENLNFVIALAP